MACEHQQRCSSCLCLCAAWSAGLPKELRDANQLVATHKSGAGNFPSRFFQPSFITPSTLLRCRGDHRKVFGSKKCSSRYVLVQHVPELVAFKAMSSIYDNAVPPNFSEKTAVRFSLEADFYGFTENVVTLLTHTPVNNTAHTRELWPAICATISLHRTIFRRVSVRHCDSLSTYVAGGSKPGSCRAAR